MSRETATEARIRTHLTPPSDLKPEATRDISAALGGLIADVFTLYLKTKNFHWHVSGPHFRDFHLLLDEQADQIFAMTDPIAERTRKVGGTTVHSSATSIGAGASRTTTPTTSSRRTCWPSSAKTTNSLTSIMREVHHVCEQTATWRPPACSRCGLTRPSVGLGFSSKRRATGPR